MPPPRKTTTEAELRAVTIGEPTRLQGPVRLVEYDPGWPARFDAEAARIRSALGARALRVEHVGSTSVPGLVAKPIIDIVLVVADSADEPAYVPALEQAGYILRIREPEWMQHRLLKDPAATVHVHVFSPGAAEIERLLRLRDRLRSSPEDRALYARTKRELATRTWEFVQQYADAKSDVIEEILARAGASSPG
jgi:GrpB-like predicted nucleotidyltransferase (UPF0157 family)